MESHCAFGIEVGAGCSEVDSMAWLVGKATFGFQFEPCLWNVVAVGLTKYLQEVETEMVGSIG